jgi:hypothetical protein
MAVLEDLAFAIEELLAGNIVRWPDAPALPVDEVIAQILLASPSSGRRILETVHVLVERAEGLEQLVTELDAVAIRFGMDADGETAAALLDVSDRIREWRER